MPAKAGIALVLWAAVICVMTPAALSQAPSSASTAPASSAPANLSSLPAWLGTTLRGVAAGALSMFSLGFAAYTFLYGTVLKLDGTSPRIVALREKLRNGVYWTAITIGLAAALVFLVFISAALDSFALSIAAIVLAGLVVLTVCGITLYLTCDIWAERKLTRDR